MNATALTRFRSKVDSSGGPDACWPWTGTTDGKGYGTFRPTGRTQDRATRIALELANGRPVRPGYRALHRCDNPICVNPTHLYEGTPSENMRDAYTRSFTRPTHCPKGHPYDAGNTYYRKAGKYLVGRQCRACAHEAWVRRATA